MSAQDIANVQADWAAIKAKGLTNLSVPREIKVVKEIPKLGTGKVNHLELQAQMSASK